jgi:hypothetical protein
MSIPASPILTCDSRRCTIMPRRHKFRDSDQEYESRTPKDLPGSGIERLTPDSFFPFDEGSSPTERASFKQMPETSIASGTASGDSTASVRSTPPPNELELDETPSANDTNSVIISGGVSSSSSSSSSTSSSASSDTDMKLFPINSPIKGTQLKKSQMTQLELELIESKTVPLRTFHFKDDFWLVQFRSYYGDIFFIRFEYDVSMGDETITLHHNKKSTVNIVSETMTKFAMESQDIVTLIDDSIIYNGGVYSTVKTFGAQESHHPSSFLVYPESALEDLVELSIAVHADSYQRIESVYRNELKSYYNSIYDKLNDFAERIQEHHDVFKYVDSTIIKESDIYYDIFDKKYKSMDPTPDDAHTKRISFLNETVLKYLQAHFIFWGRIHKVLDSAMEEFEETKTNIYLQMLKDFPDMTDIPIDPFIDIDRSYPGKLIMKDL